MRFPIFAWRMLPLKARSRYAMKKKYQVLILLAGVLLLVVSNAINFGSENEMTWAQKSTYLALLAAGIATHFFTIYGIGRWMQRQRPGLSSTLTRIGWSFAIGVPILTVLMTLTDFGLRQYSEHEVYLFTWENVLLNLTQSAVTTLYILGLTEAFYHYEQLYRSEKEREELLRINFHAQYAGLKQQVNPHFLFNSLSSLVSLISIDPAKAERFVEELSQVYRYLLQSNQEELATLNQELDFIQSYLHLLQTRYGEGFQAHIDVPEAARQRLIPPLTLQLLVENAVKHNEISVSRPLRLSICCPEEERLAVTNNLQRRRAALPSERIGLANIIARYRLLNYPYVEVREAEGEFAVFLPLITKPVP